MYKCLLAVFAYGATGAGKTFTMLGKEDSPGISYLTIKLLLELIEKSKDKLKISLYVSYIEVSCPYSIQYLLLLFYLVQ